MTTKGVVRTTSQQMMKTMRAVIKAYDKLIENPKTNLFKWHDYGHSDNCRLCKTLDKDCSICPLGPEYAACSNVTLNKLADLIEDALYTVNDGVVDMRTRDQLEPYNSQPLVKAAKARRAWLVKKFNKFCGKEIFS
jgi:hypothetical protein